MVCDDIWLKSKSKNRRAEANVFHMFQIEILHAIINDPENIYLPEFQ